MTATATPTVPPLSAAETQPVTIPTISPNVARLQGCIIAALHAKGSMREEAIVRELVERHEYTSIEKDDFSEAMVELTCQKHISWVDSGGWKAMV